MRQDALIGLTAEERLTLRSNNRIRLALAILVFIGVLAIWFGYKLYSRATLSIDLADGESVVLYNIDVTPHKEVWSGSGKMVKTIKLNKGNYLIGGNAQENYTNKFISIKSREKADVTLPYKSSDAQALKTSGNPTIAAYESSGSLSRVDDKGRYYANEKQVFSASSLGSSVTSAAINKNVFLFSNSSGNTYLYNGKETKRLFYIQEGELVNNNSVDISLVSSNMSTPDFCAASRNGDVFKIDSSGQPTKIGNLENVSGIYCSGDTYVGFSSSYSNDAPEKKANLGKITILKLSSDPINLSPKNLTDVVLNDDSTLSYISEGLVYIYQIGNSPTPVMSTVSSDASSLIRADNQNLYIVDSGQIWYLDTINKIANRISFSTNFKSIGKGFSLGQDNQLYFSVDRGNDVGNYVLTNDLNVIKQYNLLSQKLPRNDYDFTAEAYLFNNKINIDVTITAPVSSSGSKTLQEEAKAHAQTYLKSIGYDTSMVRLSYK